MHPPYATVKLQHPETLHVTPSVMALPCTALHGRHVVVERHVSQRFLLFLLCVSLAAGKINNWCFTATNWYGVRIRSDKNNYWWHTFLEFCFRMSMRLVSTFICLIWRFDSFAFSPAHISTVCQSMHPFLSSSHCFCHLFFSLFKNALCFSPPNQYYSFCSILLAVLPANSCAVTLTFSQQGFMVSCCCWGCLKCTRA